MYVMSDGNLYFTKSISSLIKEVETAFKDSPNDQDDNIKSFISHLVFLDLTETEDYFTVLEYILDTWGNDALKTFEHECKLGGIKYHPIRKA